MAERLTRYELDRFERVPGEWRDVTCRRCGARRITTQDVHSLACACWTVDGEITHTATGPTVRELLVAEVRRLRGIIAEACDGETTVDGRLWRLHDPNSPDYCGHEGATDVCKVDLLEAEAAAIRDEESVDTEAGA